MLKKQDVLRMIDMIQRDRAVEREIVFCALEEALGMATRKKMGVEEGFSVKIDRKSGQILLVSPEGELQMPSAEDLGRIAAQTTKQVFLQKIREAERDIAYEEYSDQVGQVVSARVHKIEGPNIMVQLGKGSEALLPSSERIKEERFHNGDRLRVLIKEVRKEGSRVVVIVSRKDPMFVRQLFETEIPEIAEGVIKVMKVARDPGYRSKVAVYSLDERVDCIGACLGVRGGRIRNVNDELGNERLDIIEWSDSLEQLVVNALKPAKDIQPEHVFPDVERKSCMVLVADDQKALAIGTQGRNVRLAAEIVGWSLDIKTVADYEADVLANEAAPAETPEDQPADEMTEAAPQPDLEA